MRNVLQTIRRGATMYGFTPTQRSSTLTQSEEDGQFPSNSRLFAERDGEAKEDLEGVTVAVRMKLIT